MNEAFGIIAYLVGLLLLWEGFYVIAFGVLKLHQKRTLGALQDRTYIVLSAEELRFVDGFSRDLYFPAGSFFYLCIAGEWAILKKYYWRIATVPFTGFKLARDIRRLVWEGRDWPDFQTYYRYQRRNELRARVAAAITVVGMIALMWLLVVIFGEELVDFVKTNAIQP